MLHNHCSLIQTLRSNVSTPQTPKTFYIMINHKLWIGFTFPNGRHLLIGLRWFGLSMHKRHQLGNPLSL
jgi:hypothetical protein